MEEEKNNQITEELIKRYLYLYENRELILSLCINTSIEKKYIKNEIRELKKIKTKLKKTNPDLISQIELLINIYKKELIHKKYYLFKSIDNEIVSSFEEFLFSDKSMEKTNLYKHIELIKSTPELLEINRLSIEMLEERRKNNQQLKKIPTFTVWKILSYVRRKNKDNKIALKALDKYYNLDRFIITGVDWKSGYKLLQEDIDIKEQAMEQYPDMILFSEFSNGRAYNGIMVKISHNEFEDEDDYFAYESSPELAYQPQMNYATSEFMHYLANMDMLDEQTKNNVYQNISSINSKRKLLKK